MWASQDNLLMSAVPSEAGIQRPAETSGNVYELVVDEFMPENQASYVFEALRQSKPDVSVLLLTGEAYGAPT